MLLLRNNFSPNIFRIANILGPMVFLHGFYSLVVRLACKKCSVHIVMCTSSSGETVPKIAILNPNSWGVPWEEKVPISHAGESNLKPCPRKSQTRAILGEFYKNRFPELVGCQSLKLSLLGEQNINPLTCVG